MNYQILLYYNFTRIEDPQAIRDEHFEKCTEFNLKGRILVAKEGLNGTVSGLKEDTEAYMAWMRQHPLFHATEFKIDAYDRHTFLKLHVRVKNEIVHFGLPHINPAERKFENYVEPEEWREMMKRAEHDENIVILDARSSYEYNVGKFKGAVALGIDNFREMPQHADFIQSIKDKEIYTYCTGGIKCEKVSLWLEEQGCTSVKQLHGGIVRYGHEAGGEDFEGSCYVFDQRVVVPVNTVNPHAVGHCGICGTETERMINCANAMCNKHFLICDTCADKMEGCCSEPCMHSEHRRQYDGRGYYLRGVNSKNYVRVDDALHSMG